MLTTPPTGRLGRVVQLLPVALMAVTGLLLGLGITFLALHDEDAGPSVFGGPASVATIERPAGGAHDLGITGAAILQRAQQPAVIPTPDHEPANAAEALQAFLDAEAADHSEVSYALLDPAAQKRSGSIAAWRQTRAERVVPRTASVVSQRNAAGAAEVTIRAVRTPEITPFRGFVPAVATETWRVQRTASGWRVLDGRPTAMEAELAPDAAAVAVAQRWIDGASRCDKSVAGLQLVPQLLGKPELADAACKAGRDATWRAEGAARPAADLPDLTPFVAAYGPSVGRWARGVVVHSDAATTGSSEFTVLLGPLGQEWRVLGLTSAPSA